MLRPLESMLLSVATLLVVAGLLVAAAPAGRPVPVAVDLPCPYRGSLIT